jgi:dTDP-4-dehydrorhamnose 3,5-epimerase-like enzyme
MGFVELVQVKSNHPLEMRQRSIADEVWINIQGGVSFYWHDLREMSPTKDQQYSVECEEPTIVLAPFGVAFGYRSTEEGAWLIRIATHAEDEMKSEQFNVIEQDE